MKRALISPTESAQDGQRIAQVADKDFPVAPPMFWTDCDDDVTPETHYWREKSVTQNPAPIIAPPSQRDIDRADALAKLRDASQDAAIPAKLRATLDALAKAI